MTKRPSPVSATVDFDADGVQHGFLKLPISVDDSAWGAVMIPVTVVKNGEGPTALLTGGNHGDEYEGITSLIIHTNEIEAEEVTGRVIIVPCMKAPAQRAGESPAGLECVLLAACSPADPDARRSTSI